MLLSACFNYTNLSLSRALRRSKEVGIRKIVGANHFQVFTQFLIEAVILALIAIENRKESARVVIFRRIKGPCFKREK